MTIFLPCNTIYKKDSSRASIKCLDNGPKRLLSCCIPNLHLNTRLFVDLDLLGVKLHTKSCSVALSKLVLCESIEQAALADPRRTDDDHLECFFLLLFH